MHRLLLSAGLTLALAGCSGEAAPSSRGGYLLMDTSGTSTKELHNAQAIINAILAKLEPGDSFAVARVDTASGTLLVHGSGNPAAASMNCARDSRVNFTGSRFLALASFFRVTSGSGTSIAAVGA